MQELGGTNQIQYGFHEGGRADPTPHSPLKLISYLSPTPAPPWDACLSWNSPAMSAPPPTPSQTFSFNSQNKQEGLLPLYYRQENQLREVQCRACSVTDIKQQAPETQVDQTSNIKQFMMACAYKPNIGEGEAGRSKVQGHPGLRSKFGVSLGYVRPCFKEWALNI